ncbi:L,D-transpeptidase [Solibacillus sp. MA9]|uniref:L,D-transpeptidase n=1 Tax=Solibacillus palustris TaxID=2908203 RepID=A0ABS9UBQ9_9BACL|nr:L,D-transpeptidase [Solibacillus sp. MA9]MCH7321762.1 L,D-transpeptidase [Solibacillus sp. MA9]
MTIWIDVSTSNNQLILMDDKTILKTYPIAVGKMLSPTPTGIYTIINKEVHPPAPFGALWMGLSKSHFGIHGTNNPASIDKNLPHGCIRMTNQNVQDLSSLVPLGTRVSIHK